MPILYKFAEDAKALMGMKLLASDPTKFNDPFESRPSFDQRCHDNFLKSHEEFHKKIGFPNPLFASQSLAGMEIDNVAGFSEELNSRFRKSLSGKYRVLCLSSHFSNTLMWAHYADSHRGIVLGVDTKFLGFRTGLKPDGFKIHYSKDRRLAKLPLAYYQSPSVEEYNFRGEIVNRQDQLVKSDGGIDIPFSEYRRQVVATEIAVLTNKAAEWGYEQELRFIYTLPEHSHQLSEEKNSLFVTIPVEALCEIIFGYQTPSSIVEPVIDLFKKGKIGNPKLFFAECHPYLYEVKRFPVEADYLLEYYRHVVPNR